MGLPVDPAIPDEAVPIYVADVLDVHKQARFWVALGQVGAFGVVLVALSGAYLGHWSYAWLGGALAILYVAVATATRVEEIGRSLKDQVRDRLLDDHGHGRA